MDKSKIEDICRRSGMKPEARQQFRDHEIFVADGFSLPPHPHYRKFGIEADDFPGGMYTTLWWVSRKEDKLDTGQPLFFDVFHDREYDAATKKQARIGAAIKTATDFIKQRAAIAKSV